MSPTRENDPLCVEQDPADSFYLEVSVRHAFGVADFHIHKSEALRLSTMLRDAAMADPPRRRAEAGR
jgi:hypothetical protein